LAKAQADATHLCAVGHAWLSWIERPEGHEAIKVAAKDFHATRSSWANVLRKSQDNMVNALRVASNLASNQLTWHVMEQHPDIGPAIREQRDAHYVNLSHLAGEMASYTTTALEANKFLELLRELLASGRAVLRDRQASGEKTDPDRLIGWKNADGTANILPSVARSLVDRLSPNALGGVSGKTLCGQMADRGVLASSDQGKHEKTIKVDGHSYKTIHLTAEAMTVDEEE
jgi:hypothetical protein